MQGRLLGIVQGRLTPSPGGVLQYFPQKGWREEFERASRLGFQYIELFAERVHNERNPIWSDSGIQEIRRLNLDHRLIPYSICNDYVIDHNLSEKVDAVEQTCRLIERSSRLGVRTLVLPLLEESGITESDAGSFVDPVRRIADTAREYEMWVCLETLLDGKSLTAFIECVDRANVAACFDTGNRAALGHDIYSDILLLGRRIRHVHVKDKDLNGNNVYLGTGRVNLHKALEALNAVGYEGAFTFETTRGRDPVRTAEYHASFLTFHLHEISAESH